MGFSLILAILALKFKKVSQGDPGFKKFLMGHECVIVVKTKDGRKGKRFIFRDGAFSSDAVLDEYDAAMIWSDAKAAFKGLKAGEEGVQEALRNHQVSIDGEVHSFTWFGAAMTYVMG